MTKAQLGILESSLEELEKSNDAKTSNEVIVETIRILLKGFDFSHGTLSDYNKLEIRDLFSLFGEVIESARDFYKTSGKYLDSTALNGDLGRLYLEKPAKELSAAAVMIEDDRKNSLERAEKELAATIAAIKHIEQSNAELLKMEKELNKKGDIKKEREEKVASLKKIKDAVSDEVLAGLNGEAAKLKETIEKNEPRKTELERLIREYNTVLTSMSGMFARMNDEKKTIEENIIEKINENRETVQQIFDEQSKDLRVITAEIENYKRQSADLENVWKEANERHKIYRLHYGENSKIAGMLTECGVLSLDDFIHEIERSDLLIKEELEKFDGQFKRIFLEQEEAQKEIERLQNVSIRPEV